MFKGTYAFDDMKLLFEYLEKEAPGRFVQMSIQTNGTLQVYVKNKLEEDITINIFDENTKLFPKIFKEERLSHVLKGNK